MSVMIMKRAWEYNYGSWESRCLFISMNVKKAHTTQFIKLFHKIGVNDSRVGVLLILPSKLQKSFFSVGDFPAFWQASR